MLWVVVKIVVVLVGVAVYSSIGEVFLAVESLSAVVFVVVTAHEVHVCHEFDSRNYSLLVPTSILYIFLVDLRHLRDGLVILR